MGRTGPPALATFYSLSLSDIGRYYSLSQGSVMQSQHRDMNGHSPMTPTPLFERLVTEEVQELKASLRMIENLQRRLDELERVHGELEARLELEAQGKSQLESMLEERERDWAAKFQRLETEKDEWKYQLEREKSKTEQLTMLLNRKNQDIHRMLQRKVRTTLSAHQKILGSR